MEKSTILQIVDLVSDIGESSRHYVSVSISTSEKNFAVIVYVMNKEYGDVNDTRYFNSDVSWLMYRNWLTGWKSIIETERDEDETN